MKMLSLYKVQYSNENDASLKFVHSLDGASIKYNDKEITIEDEDKFHFTSLFNSIEDIPLAGKLNYHFTMNSFRLRLVTQNKLAETINGVSNEIIIACIRHDNFALHFNVYKIDGFSTTSQLNMYRHNDKKIEYIKFNPNPLKILEKDPFGNTHSLRDQTHIYAQIIYNIMVDLQKVKKELKLPMIYEMVAYYAIELMVHYQKNAMGILPREIVNNLKNQLSKAATMVIENLEMELMINVIDEFLITYDILEKLEKYKIDNNLQKAFDA